MQNQTIIGIDVSSATLDICVTDNTGQRSFVIDNKTTAISRFLCRHKDECLIIGMENTGRYNWALYEVLTNLHHKVFVISPLHLKRSMGLVRGKNDKVDAIRIAAFIEKNYDNIPQWKPTPAVIQKLKILLTERNSRIKAKRQLLKQQHDYVKMQSLNLDKVLLKMNRLHLALINKQLVQIEDNIEKVIKSDEQLYRQAELIRSVPGAGKVLCWMMLAKTEGFTIITEPRKMACYSGVVPFSNQSGTSIRSKDRISVYADKAMKTTLHLAAMSAIRLKNDLREYYLRKVAEGKNKMSALNAVRNKIVHRIFAVIKNQIPYQSNLVLS